MPAGERQAKKIFRLVSASGRQMRYQVRWWSERGKFGEAPGLRLVDGGRAVQIEQIEPERRHRQFVQKLIHIHLPPKTAHRHLERLWTPTGIEAESFAIQNQIVGGKSANGLHDLGYGLADVVRSARIDNDIITGLVGLDPCAVELVFERGGPSEFVESFGDILRSLCQHGLD